MKLPPKIMTRAELRAIRAANGVVIARRWPLSPRRHHMRIDTTIPWRQSEHGKAKIQASNARPENQTANRDRMRAYGAKRDGYAPPPLERDCPPRPAPPAVAGAANTAAASRAAMRLGVTVQ